jgi:choline transport protein
MAGTAFAVAQQLQGLIALNMPDYAIQGWHGTLLSIAIVLCSILGNTILVKKLPLMEGLALVLHVFGFFAFLVVLWVMGPRSNVHDTWTKFEDPSGWGNTGLATLVGVLGPILSLGSADLAIHLAEEVEEASYNIPRAMIATSAVNYTFAFVMTVTVFSTLGNDVMAIMSTPFGQPWIQILMNILTVVVCLLLLFASVNQVTAASRQLWSFARDKGLPFSGWLSYVGTYHLDVRSIANLCIGPPRMGHPLECGVVHADVFISTVPYHHWFIHRFQHHPFIRRC